MDKLKENFNYILVGFLLVGAVIVTSYSTSLLYKSKLESDLGTRQLIQLRDEASNLSGDISKLSAEITVAELSLSEKKDSKKNLEILMADKIKKAQQIETAVFYMKKATESL